MAWDGVITSPVTERVERGMALLDEKAPDWLEKINVEALDISNGRICALAQIYGSYGFGCRDLGLSEWGQEAQDCGFLYAENDPTEGWHDSNQLNAEWRRQIKARRKA